MTPENEQENPIDPDVPPEFLRPDDLNTDSGVPADYLPPAELPVEPPFASSSSFELPPVPEPANPFELPAIPDEPVEHTDFPSKPPTPVEDIPDVPPEYLGMSEDVIAANEAHPLPTTDVPAEYLDLEPAIPEPSPVYQPETPVEPAPAFARETPAKPAPAYPAAKKERGIALILEILPGLFGFLGIGWIYAGNLTVGLIALIGFLVFVAIEVVIAIVTLGFGACCLLPLNIIIVAVSALLLNNYIQQHPDQFN